MSHRSTLISLGLVGAIVAAAGACAPGKPSPEHHFRARLMTSVAVSGRWERAAERGLGLIAAELGAEVARVRTAGSVEQRSFGRWRATGSTSSIASAPISNG